MVYAWRGWEQKEACRERSDRGKTKKILYLHASIFFLKNPILIGYFKTLF